MSVMSIRVDDEKRKMLKAIASIEGKTLSSLVGKLIEEYIQENKAKLKLLEKSESSEFMKLSEESFSEWDNEEDAIYDNL